MIRPLVTIALLVALAGPAVARPLKAAEEANIKPDGPPVNCVQINQIRETRVRNDSTIDFYMAGGKVYRNTLPNSCPQLGFEERFGYQTSINQLCNVDIITVFTTSPPMRGASCGLGSFQPISGAPK